MDGLTMSKFEEAFKREYLDVIAHQVNTGADPFASKIERSGDEIVGGDKARFLVTAGKNGGFGNRADDGDIPLPSTRTFLQVEVPTKNLIGVFQLTSKLMKSSQSNKAAFINAMTYAMESLTEDAKANYARQLHGKASGVITTLTAGASATATLTVGSARHLYPGMRIDIVATGGTVKASSKLIIDADNLGTTVVLEAAVTAASGDEIFVSGSRGLEMVGLDDIFTQDNTIYNINRANNKFFNAILSGTTGDISDAKIQGVLDKITIRTGESPDLIVAAFNVLQFYGENYELIKRTVNSTKLEGGWEAIFYKSTPMVASVYKADGVMDILTTKTFKLHQIADWGWMDQHGNVLAPVAGKTAYQGILEKYCELGCRKPAANARLTGITG